MTNETKEVTEGVENLDLSTAIYTSEKHGSDETGNGTTEKPYKTTALALKKSGKIDTFSAIFVDAKDEATGKYELISKTQLKKIRNYCEAEAKKEAQRHTKELEDAQRREKNLEEAKKL
jgi:asparaginyl-tRNA synthetase